VSSRILLTSLVLFAIASPHANCLAQESPRSPVLVAMRQELARSLTTLKTQPLRPHFLSYEITEVQSAQARASFGTVLSWIDEHHRLLGLDVRVGTPAFDNTHIVAGGMPAAFMRWGRFSLGRVPLGDDTVAMRRVIWYQTDRAYKNAVEQLTRARAGAQLRVAPEDTSPDFSPEPPVTYREPAAGVKIDRAAWEAKLRAYTAPFARQKDIYDGDAFLKIEGETRWYVNSEGAELQTSSAYYRLVLSAHTRADDGMILPRYESFVASSPAKLPDDATIARTVEKMIADLNALKKAPVVTSATAPAILTGRASGVFFHEVFGHRVEGHRQKDEDEAQTFKGKIGERLLPPEFSVYFDPTVRTLGGVELAGSYRYDNEGVAARRVDVVRDGVFKGFLMSRSPIAGFSRSNGHGRRMPGMPAVARQSNLIVTTSKPVSRAALKRMLLDEIKRQNQPFGLIFDDIEGGFTITGRFFPNAFEVIPIMVYRVFPDGREELVRGVDLIGTPLTAFSRIIAADDVTAVFNGICGAESGWVPVSAASPAILVSQIEVQRKPKAQEKAPILPPPVEER
jgi:TldD protein